MNLPMDVHLALTLARYHESDVRRSFHPKPRRRWRGGRTTPTRPVPAPTPELGVTAVPVLPTVPQPRSEPVNEPVSAA
jgi:hypothetical protein